MSSGCKEQLVQKQKLMILKIEKKRTKKRKRKKKKMLQQSRTDAFNAARAISS
jgi:hypothetical protein